MSDVASSMPWTSSRGIRIITSSTSQAALDREREAESADDEQRRLKREFYARHPHLAP